MLEPCGLTKGFERHHRADFYREHKRPKKLWLKTLSVRSSGLKKLTEIDFPTHVGMARWRFYECSRHSGLPHLRVAGHSIGRAIRRSPLLGAATD